MMFAHSRNSDGQRHDLVQHLQTVAICARAFAANFNSEELAYYAGLWHDLGKFHPDFQSYLQRCEINTQKKERGPGHKGAGAIFALHARLNLLSLLIHGHHGGLRSKIDYQNWIRNQKEDNAARDAIEAASQAIPNLMPACAVKLPAIVEKDPTATELLIRLLFSALVDADYLDTEHHFDSDKYAERGPPDVTLQELWTRFERNQATLPYRPDSVVDQARRTIYESALVASKKPRGLFRLTVPTGSGKTRSGMAFALGHALQHGLKRVIVAVPYTSITEQTAKEYRDIFGTDRQGRSIVLEHHSQMTFSGTDQDEDFRRAQTWARLAAENWDAPIIVTTTVQLLQSLFSNSTSRMRKVHRTAGSVIILDEVQALPPRLLEPIVDALRHLTGWGGSTVVLSTATQPTFEAIDSWASLDAVEIVADSERWFKALQRVKYEWKIDMPVPWEMVAEWLQAERQGLAVVNLKQDAFQLLDALDDEEVLHLSTQLCGLHRRNVIREVQERLRQGQTCRLVSTQVIEAGVNLDFPFVIRALAPLDSIIQAAGRCNREGFCKEGRVIVFCPEGSGTPPGAYRTATQVAQAVLGEKRDMDDPDMVKTYFGRLFQSVSTDEAKIQARRRQFDFPEVAKRFRMIDDETESVIITDYGTAEERQCVNEVLQRLKRRAGQRHDFRQLQPYAVSVRTYKASALKQRGLIEPVAEGIGVWRGQYDPIRGLTEAGINPDELVF